MPINTILAPSLPSEKMKAAEVGPQAQPGFASRLARATRGAE